MYAQAARGGVRVVLEGVELRLLDDLLNELSSTLEAVAPAADAADDPFAWWESQERDGGIRTGGSDPAVDRLFPRAASHEVDPQGELSAFSHAVMSEQRSADLATVRANLAAVGGGGRVEVAGPELESWLRTLNAINLLLTARLGIVDVVSADEVARAASDDDHPVAFLYHVHQWVAGVLESILDVTLH
ncbi:MAG: DUF2017 family protein [Propionibacterium sp.]|nr:DUF2017 family protein [Propionibacterium sp.]